MNEKSAKILLERGLREQAPGKFSYDLTFFPPVHCLIISWMDRD